MLWPLCTLYVFTQYMVHTVCVVRHSKETNSNSDNNILKDISEKIKGKKLASVIIKRV